MDVTIFVDLIQTLGLPIALIIVMGAFIWKLYKRSEEREKVLMQQVAECQKINADAVSTLAIYSERLGIVEQDVKEIKEDVNVIVNQVTHTGE